MKTAKHARHKRPAIVKDFFMGLAVVGILTVGKIAFEKTYTGAEFERFMFILLQWRLTPSFLDGRPPAQIIDIGSIVPTQVSSVEGKVPLLTSRSELRRIIADIVEQRPKSVGIDIDFSSLDENTGAARFLSGEDEEFMDFCLRLSNEKRVPIFIGLWRTLELSAETRLVASKFSGLGADIGIPNEEKILDHHWPKGTALDARWAYRWRESDLSGSRVPSMGTALAGGEGRNQGGWADQILCKERVIHLSEGISAGISLANYGALRSLQLTCIKAPSRESIVRNGSNIRGAVVVVGDATRFEAIDTFNVPGERDPIPGVFLHACAALTFMGGGLYELTHVGRIVADVVVGAIALGIIACVCMYSKRRKKSGVLDVHKLHNLVTMLAICAVVAIGFVGVQWWGIFWPDCVLVAVALALHSPAHESVFRIIPTTFGGTIWKR